MLQNYQKHKQERQEQGLPPLPLDASQTQELVKIFENGVADEFCLDLLINQVPPGVDESAYVKAAFLKDIALENIEIELISPAKAIELLGTMLGGYSVEALVEILKANKFGPQVVNALKNTILVYDSFNDIFNLRSENKYADEILNSWANAEWFTNKPELEEEIQLTVYKVSGETNTDDFSPAKEAWSRPDIPLHAQAFLKWSENIDDPLEKLSELKYDNQKLVFVGDVVGTGSSRKSAANSMLWHMGEDIPFVPAKKTGGFCFGNKIAPIFYNTLQDSGAFPIELDVDSLTHGREIILKPYERKIYDAKSKEELISFDLKSDVIFDEVRAGGRINLIIGRQLTDKTREKLGLKPSEVFQRYGEKSSKDKGFTLAQKMVGKACGLKGVRAGQYCEPRMTTVGSQDTTGPMTRDELKELACLGFSADLVMQSFCHTAAYPKPVDEITHRTLPDFFINRGGISLRPGDGIIHSWLNRMLLPDTVGTGGDSHTRFPIGISFPAGSGMVAFAATLGVMPLEMPESVLVRFSGKLNPGITIRDLVHAIPYFAMKEGLLTLDKKNKKNIFSGRCLEIEGLPDLKIEQAFELSDASAERSASGCTVKLDKEPIIEYLKSNVTLLRWMISDGYHDPKTLERRAKEMEDWIKNPDLMEADVDAEYAAIIDISLDEITEPLLCCPNDPDDVKTLSEVAGDKVHETFVGSCMTNIGHFRAAGKLLEKYGEANTRLWIVPPTRMDEHQLKQEGYYKIFENSKARVEIPGCSLCMGNQARAADGTTMVSTSTRNFPNRMGDGCNVYLASSEVTAISSLLGKIPNLEEYQDYMKDLNTMSSEVFRYMNFNEIEDYLRKVRDMDISHLDIEEIKD
ncbi:MAG: bifunctional aconitate hydratase 2/2-methylisocitrate dehydratase [Gammaproteobacteria bacterium]|nr:bifunctional aconitate hydratase 2/2-methylisocitrate dehydratase [Gammaproteobacteria bacterium]